MGVTLPADFLSRTETWVLHKLTASILQYHYILKRKEPEDRAVLSSAKDKKILVHILVKIDIIS